MTWPDLSITIDSIVYPFMDQGDLVKPSIFRGIRFLALCITLLTVSMAGSNASDRKTGTEPLVYKDPTASIDSRLDDLAARMSVEEKFATGRAPQHRRVIHTTIQGGVGLSTRAGRTFHLLCGDS
jgi:hypothetical protein